MENINSQNLKIEHIHWGHFGLIVSVVVVLVGVSYMKKPELFSFKKNTNQNVADDSRVPKYFAYVTPREDLPTPAVLGVNTNQGPSIIGDDGNIQQVDLGQVLGVSTQGVELSLDTIKINLIPNSNEAIKKYFLDAQNLEIGSIVSSDFASALNSGNQEQINIQAKKITDVRDVLQKLPVPESLAKLQKLKIVQYNSSIALLKNFTLANQNPNQISNDMQQFLKSQQDLESENETIAQKYGDLFPYSMAYINSLSDPSFSNTSNITQ